MFNNAMDVAKAAIDLTEHARDCANRGQLLISAQIDLSAAALAVHVADWHALPNKLDDKLRDRFRAFSPAWGVLKDIVNGVKHPHKKPGPHELRDLAWEDRDFWEAGSVGRSICVQIGGEWRSVHALTVDFCGSYLTEPERI